MAATAKNSKDAASKGATEGAYSRLSEIMQSRKLTVAGVHRQIRARGHEINLKTIYRLASEKPLLSISTPVIRAVCEVLSVDIGKLLVWEAPEPKLQQLNPKAQARLNYLMARNNDGELNAKEHTELEKLAADLEELSIRNAKLVAKHVNLERRKVATDARPQRRQINVDARLNAATS